MFLGRTPDCRFDAIEHHVDSGVPGLNQTCCVVQCGSTTWSRVVSLVTRYRKAIVEIYSIHKPDNVMKVDYLLEKHSPESYSHFCLSFEANDVSTCSIHVTVDDVSPVQGTRVMKNFSLRAFARSALSRERCLHRHGPTYQCRWL